LAEANSTPIAQTNTLFPQSRFGYPCATSHLQVGRAVAQQPIKLSIAYSEYFPSQRR
jgi:hypothetical protein